MLRNLDDADPADVRLSARLDQSGGAGSWKVQQNGGNHHESARPWRGPLVQQSVVRSL